MSKTGTAIPSRASKPTQVTPDVEQEYDDDTVGQMPRSAIRFRSTYPQDTTSCTTGPIVAPITHRVSGSTRFGLYASYNDASPSLLRASGSKMMVRTH